MTNINTTSGTFTIEDVSMSVVEADTPVVAKESFKDRLTFAWKKFGDALIFGATIIVGVIGFGYFVSEVDAIRAERNQAIAQANAEIQRLTDENASYGMRINDLQSELELSKARLRNKSNCTLF